MKIVRLGEVAKRANTKEDKDNTDRIYYAAGEHIIPGELRIKEGGLIEGSTIGPMFYFGFKAGQLLLHSRSFMLKKAAVADFDGICSEKVFVLETIDSNILLQEYLPFVVQNDNFWEYAEENKSGSVNFFLNWDVVADYEFELPSIEEQRVLADKLWAAYELKEAYKKMIVATDEMVKSQFIEMFGDNNTVSLCDVAHITMGSSPDSEYYNENGEGLPFYQGKTEFGDMYIKPAVIFCTEPVREADVNDILMSVRAPVGAVNIAQEHCCIGRGLAAIRTKSEKMTPLFLYYALKIKEDNIAALGTGSTFKAINKDVVYSIQIPASTMDEQQKFVAIAQQADKSKFELRQAIDKIDKVMKSLLQ